MLLFKIASIIIIVTCALRVLVFFVRFVKVIVCIIKLKQIADLANDKEITKIFNEVLDEMTKNKS